MAELTEKQKRFADYYIESGSATEAARKAGYSDRTIRGHAHKMLRNVAVRAYIDDHMKKADKDRIASAEEVLEFLTSVVRGEVIERVPILIGNGVQELVENTPTVQAREKAAELLGKRYMLWTDRQHVEGTLGVQIVDDIK